MSGSENGQTGASGESISHFDLPKSNVQRIAKAAIPSDAKLSAEVVSSLVKASTVFVSYLTAIAQDASASKNKKTITAAHVLEAVPELGWDDAQMIAKQLKKDLEGFREAKAAKSKSKKPTEQIIVSDASENEKDDNEFSEENALDDNELTQPTTDSESSDENENAAENARNKASQPDSDDSDKMNVDT